jgi:hypothetical protein
MMPAAGAPSSLPPSRDGAPGFFSEQLQRAAVEAGTSGAAEETPAVGSNAASPFSANLRMPASVLPVGVSEPAIPIVGADGNVQSSLALPGGVPSDVSLIRSPINNRKGAATASDSALSGARGSSRKSSPDTPTSSAPANPFLSINILPSSQNAVPVSVSGNASDVANRPSPDFLPASSATPITSPIPVATPVIQTGGASVNTKSANNTDPDPSQNAATANQTPSAPAGAFVLANVLPSNQNSTPSQVPASRNASGIDGQPTQRLLQTEGSDPTIRTTIHPDTPFTSNVGDLAFAAKIKTSDAAGQTPGHSASSIVTAGPASQIGKNTGEASAKQGDSGYEQQENPASQTSASDSSAAKPSFRKDEPADAAPGATGSKTVESNAVQTTAADPGSGQPNITVLAQTIPQSASAGVLNEPRSASAPQSGAPVEQTHILLDKTAQASSPAKSISLQVEGPSGQTIDIRIASRATDLNVAVRAGDDNVAQNLRQGLGDLETHLAQNGYRAETWHPGHSGSTEPVAAGSNSSSSSSSQQQSQSGHGSQQNRQQRDNNPSNRPRWVNEMAASLKSESTEKGNQNGIAS